MAPTAGLLAIGLGAVGLTWAAFAGRRKAERPMDPITIELETITDYRRAAWAAVNYAVDGAAGRPAHGDPVYTEITLGLQDAARAQGWFFSSCAFLPHWMLESLGLVRPYIGRSTLPDQPLSRLAWGADSRPVTPTTDLRVGDVVQIGSNGDSHVLVVLAYVPPSPANAGHGRLDSADYGQPGGKLRSRTVTVSLGQLVATDEAKSRVIRRYVPLAEVVRQSAAELGSAGGPTVLYWSPELMAWWHRAPAMREEP